MPSDEMNRAPRLYQIAVMMTLLSALTIFSTRALGYGNDPIYRPVANQMLKLLSKSDVLIFGENHDIKENRELLMTLLKEGVARGQVDTFVTEYSIEETEGEFQSYLTNVNAIAQSKDEDRLFDLYAREDYRWFQSEFNKDFFRFLRELKLKFGDRIKICGLDVQMASYLSDDHDEQVKISAARFKTLPTRVLNRILTSTGRTMEQLAQAGEGYDKEAMMGVRAANCMAGRKKVIIHVGQFHSYADGYRDSADKHWLFASDYVRTLSPGKKVLSVADGQVKSEDIPLSKMFTSLNQAASVEVPRLFKTGALPRRVKDLFYIENGDHSRDSFVSAWDYIILGPEGTALGIF